MANVDVKKGIVEMLHRIELATLRRKSVIDPIGIWKYFVHLIPSS